MFSGAENAMQLVDEIRQHRQSYGRAAGNEADLLSTELFFIFNREDRNEAEAITDFLANEIPLEVLMIEPSTQQEFRRKTVQQLPETKLAVIYFKNSGDWAIPFIKQIWKEVGGARAPNVFALVGDDDPETNLLRIFKAPKVISRITGRHRIADEIRSIYHSLTG
jgi:hypothetical protein